MHNQSINHPKKDRSNVQRKLPTNHSTPSSYSSHILQMQKTVGNRQTQKLITGTQLPIQRRPIKNPMDESEYIDQDYPLLRMTKPGKPSNKYIVKESGEEVYYEPGEGYFSDYGCTKKLDMSKYQGNLNEREGVSNNEGQSFYYLDNKHTGGFFPIMEALELAKALNEEKNQTFNETKVASVGQEIKEKKTIYPIEVSMGVSGYRLVQGRHRIVASLLSGLPTIPYNNV
jgi:hypothetical protein